jgi:hypothetical protein
VTFGRRLKKSLGFLRGVLDGLRSEGVSQYLASLHDSRKGLLRQ